ncbi:hypothetical protein [Labilibaculum euxinus]|uniref:Bacteriocin n=1 Tax=Labilibaculum euxinus TaxID=2686357 RepID=A0A7M4DAN7_9BACT|nr:hypothetical protein [Labilibaculum euxinus]MUP39716.1 hypothetical protein [Labilibaculum euxinus]MVB08921.1 hypothetical protein [Labilibaculum euxinus]
MKDLQKLNGAKILSKKEQQTVKGGHGVRTCNYNSNCPEGSLCIEGICFEIPLV